MKSITAFSHVPNHHNNIIYNLVVTTIIMVNNTTAHTSLNRPLYWTARTARNTTLSLNLYWKILRVGWLQQGQAENTIFITITISIPECARMCNGNLCVSRHRAGGSHRKRVRVDVRFIAIQRNMNIKNRERRECYQAHLRVHGILYYIPTHTEVESPLQPPWFMRRNNNDTRSRETYWQIPSVRVVVVVVVVVSVDVWYSDWPVVVDRVVLMARNNTDNDEDHLLLVLFALPVAYKLPHARNGGRDCRAVENSQESRRLLRAIIAARTHVADLLSRHTRIGVFGFPTCPILSL